MSDLMDFDPDEYLKRRMRGVRNVVIVALVVVAVISAGAWNMTRMASQEEVRELAETRYGVTIDGYVGEFDYVNTRRVTIAWPDGSTTEQRCFQQRHLTWPWQRRVSIRCAEPGEGSHFKELPH